MARGGKRKGAGRKPALVKKRSWMLKIRPAHARFITERAKACGIPIGDFVAISVLYAEQQKRKE